MRLPPLFARHRSAWLWVAAWLAALVLSIAAVAEMGRRTADNHIRQEAAHAARHYAHLISAAVPGLERLLLDGRTDATMLERLRSLGTVGAVFRFKLFDGQGRLVLVSDQLDHPGLGADGSRLGYHHGEREADRIARRVLDGDPHIELKDGRGRVDRPPVYTEAYMPLVREGRTLGVIEVYVDQTAMRVETQQAFARIGLAVGAAFLLLGALGAGQTVMRLRAQRRDEEQMRYLARHDALSGALNRVSFNDALKHAAWRHQAGGEAFAVLCMDLDRFKEVNDSLGHGAGDEVLRLTTERLRGLLRHGDQLARLGGDEFAVLQASVSGPGDVAGLARRIVETLGQPYEVQGQRLLCGASVGAAVFGHDADSTAELLHMADLALYRAKANGRGDYSFYEADLDRQLQERRDLTRDLRAAIAEQRLALHYQRLLAADGHTLLGYEALLRWQHPVRGAVPPAVFVPLAEDNGLIESLGAWVLHRACREAAGWPAPLSVSVNLSAAQFRQGDLLATVQAALRDSGLPASRLELEITESLLIGDTEQVLAKLNALSAMGVRIAMDDFGTGYSSLAYLWRFPFDKVKIDRAFTQAMTEDPRVSTIVRSIVSLAHALKIRVNAEGVETTQQMSLLQQHGCDELQGYLLGRPAQPELLNHAGAAPQAQRRRPADTVVEALPTQPMPL